MKNNKKQIPIDVIERWLKDSDWSVREAAMNACQGKDVPIETIERWLKDSDWSVRKAAMNAAKSKGIVVSPTRTIEPPKTVYKKCVGGVIICASMPNDAAVRGKKSGKCRTNSAVITKVIGDYCGEPVGISMWDKTTTYYEGDEIFVEDFDLSDEECSTGFHFFCTKAAAERY